jgi:hypothetical protein
VQKKLEDIQLNGSLDKFLPDSLIVKDNEEKTVLKGWLPPQFTSTKLLLRGSEKGFKKDPFQY